MPTATKEVTEARERATELRKQREKALEDAKAAIASAPDEDGKLVIDNERVKASREGVAKAAELREEIAQLDAFADEIEWKGGNGPLEKSIADLANAINPTVDPDDGKSLAELFAGSQEYKEFVESGGDKSSAWKVPKAAWREAFHAKDVFSTMPTGTPATFGAVRRETMVPRAHRTFRIRDLLGARPITEPIVEFFRVTGFTNAASTVGERDGSSFATKPQSSLTFAGTQASAKTIAHWEAAHRNTLADESQLQGIIENELLYGLQLEEDNQILNGDGTGNNLQGIHTDSGIQSYNWSSGTVGDNKADAVRRAATLAFIANYEATGVAIHPNDWEDMELVKDDNGQYLLAVSIAIGGEKRLWRMPVAETAAENDGRALVGAFGLGAQLYDKEEATIRISDSHASFFVQNALAILAEERLILTIPRPEAFVSVSFNSAPTA